MQGFLYAFIDFRQECFSEINQAAGNAYMPPPNIWSISSSVFSS